jgi:ATP adenylyltransferase
MSTRSRKNHRIYSAEVKRNKQSKTCHFCRFKASDDQVVSDHTYFWIVRNIFPYDLWDNCGVLDHLMIVPKKHTDTLSHLKTKEQIEYMNLLAEYESTGYSIYSRAPGNTRKSVFHLHTHLVKLDNKEKNLIIFCKRPNFLIVK